MANDDQVKGKFDNLKGRVKQAFGTATGDKEKEAEGLGERIAGAAREKVGDAKEEIRKHQERREIDDEDEDL